MARMNFGGVRETVVTRDEFPLSKARRVLKDEVTFPPAFVSGARPVGRHDHRYLHFSISPSAPVRFGGKYSTPFRHISTCARA